MKTPRDVHASELIKLLAKHGYIVANQIGSHIKLSKVANDGIKHNIVVPNHKPIKVGTLQSIAKEVCLFNKININDFYSQL